MFEVRNVICKNCGFVFVSPAPDEFELIKYYNDSFTKHAEQSLDYNIEKRKKIILEFVSRDSKTFLEVGSNSKSEFHTWLDSFFNDVITIEPNNSVESSYKDVGGELIGKFDCIAHYFVLEHIPDPQSFFEKYASILNDNGVMICEVPSLDLYSSYISPLILFEHVNHFTPSKLSEVAARAGLKMIFNSKEKCSRPYGFVAVFIKDKIENNFCSEYERNLELFKEGMNSKNKFFEDVNRGWEIIKECEKNNEIVIVWAANETTNHLFSNREIPKNVIVIDSNPQKSKYLHPTPVYTPEECFDEIVSAKKLIVCTQLHFNDIINHINKKFKRKFFDGDVLIVDKL